MDSVNGSTTSSVGEPSKSPSAVNKEKKNVLDNRRAARKRLSFVSHLLISANKVKEESDKKEAARKEEEAIENVLQAKRDKWNVEIQELEEAAKVLGTKKSWRKVEAMKKYSEYAIKEHRELLSGDFYLYYDAMPLLNVYEVMGQHRYKGNISLIEWLDWMDINSDDIPADFKLVMARFELKMQGERLYEDMYEWLGEVCESVVEMQEKRKEEEKERVRKEKEEKKRKRLEAQDRVIREQEEAARREQEAEERRLRAEAEAREMEERVQRVKEQRRLQALEQEQQRIREEQERERQRKLEEKERLRLERQRAREQEERQRREAGAYFKNQYRREFTEKEKSQREARLRQLGPSDESILVHMTAQEAQPLEDIVTKCKDTLENNLSIGTASPRSTHSITMHLPSLHPEVTTIMRNEVHSKPNEVNGKPNKIMHSPTNDKLHGKANNEMLSKQVHRQGKLDALSHIPDPKFRPSFNLPSAESSFTSSVPTEVRLPASPPKKERFTPSNLIDSLLPGTSDPVVVSADMNSLATLRVRALSPISDPKKLHGEKSRSSFHLLSAESSFTSPVPTEVRLPVSPPKKERFNPSNSIDSLLPGTSDPVGVSADMNSPATLRGRALSPISDPKKLSSKKKSLEGVKEGVVLDLQDAPVHHPHEEAYHQKKKGVRKDELVTVLMQTPYGPKRVIKDKAEIQEMLIESVKLPNIFHRPPSMFHPNVEFGTFRQRRDREQLTRKSINQLGKKPMTKSEMDLKTKFPALKLEKRSFHMPMPTDSLVVSSVNDFVPLPRKHQRLVK